MGINGDGTLTLWHVVTRDDDDTGLDSMPSDDYAAALRAAKEIGGKLIESTYKYVSQEEIEDFSPKCERCGDVISAEDEESIDFDDEHCEECRQAIWKEENEPGEDDITTGDYRRFAQYGKIVLDVGPDADDWKEQLEAYMKREGFWPTVWFISDHGNCDVIDLTK